MNIRVTGTQMKIDELKNPIILDIEFKQSIFLFRVSEKSLEFIQLALYYMGKWIKNLRETTEKILKKIYIKACNENKFRVFLMVYILWYILYFS